MMICIIYQRGREHKCHKAKEWTIKYNTVVPDEIQQFIFCSGYFQFACYTYVLHCIFDFEHLVRKFQFIGSYTTENIETGVQIREMGKI